MVGNRRPLSALAGDDTRVLERVAVEGQDAHERRVEGEEHARLDLRRARQILIEDHAGDLGLRDSEGPRYSIGASGFGSHDS